MKDPYEVLGISPDATDIEVKNAYRALARKYHPDNFQKGDPMADLATERMKEINEAYDRVQKERAGKTDGYGETSSGSDGTGNVYVKIRNLINMRRFREAEAELARISAADRTADWHYLTSLTLMQRGYVNDAMRELEEACNMDPENREYQQAKQMFNQSSQGFGSPFGRSRNMGMSGCDICQGLICADCCCECMGGDLIPCC
ncbi:MAG: DnaJ domain-containing protein [Clostridia bacterium]|nr:DnaJ domain-containing protein [Clostridia bacterium]